MGVVLDPDDDADERRLLLPVKLNVGKMPAGIGFSICGEDETSAASSVVYDLDPVSGAGIGLRLVHQSVLRLISRCGRAPGKS